MINWGLPGDKGEGGIPPGGPAWVYYNDLSGGLNTKKDVHALSRNQLAVSINAWMPTGNAISKRPGSQQWNSVPFATGSGLAGVSMQTCQFSDITYALVQSGGNIYAVGSNGSTWANIGTVTSGGIMRAAQLYDPDFPNAPSDAVFIVTGADVPRVWAGPTHSIVNCALTPPQTKSSTTIKPAYVDTVNSQLFYAGDASDLSAVYVSDPFRPESFTQNVISTQTGSQIGYNQTYIPYLIGRNDGVNGGDVTGIMRLGQTMMVYKQSAIYNMAQTGQWAQGFWTVTLVSASVGLLSPRSLVSFDTFHCFLGIDGVYTIDPYNGARRVSDNVPTYFDGSLSGYQAAIAARTTAVGVRAGQRYLLFYDSGSSNLP